MEHFDEERLDEQRLRKTLLVRWVLGFASLFVFVLGAFWWSGSAVKYGASRVGGKGQPTYEVTGQVTDSLTRRGIPWASITTEITSGTQFFETSADSSGAYSLKTMAEPHQLIFRANGYREARIPVGKQWFPGCREGRKRGTCNSSRASSSNCFADQEEDGSPHDDKYYKQNLRDSRGRARHPRES